MLAIAGAAEPELKHQTPTSRRQRNTKSQIPNTNKSATLKRRTIFHDLSGNAAGMETTEYTEDTEKKQLQQNSDFRVFHVFRTTILEDLRAAKILSPRWQRAPLRTRRLALSMLKALVGL
jgi:hypothetical protein